MTEFVINKTVRIVTTFSRYAKASADEIPVISYELFYHALQPMPLMTGLLAGNNKQEIKLKGADGFIHGYLLTTVNDEEMVLLGNLFYGGSNTPALQTHFDGTIAIYSFKEHPVPPAPPVPLKPLVPPLDPNDSTEDLGPDMSIGAPLFPYVDVQPWPTASITAQSWQFFSYDPANTSPNSLYSVLIPLAVAKDRSNMEAQALQFLQNGSVFTGQYFGSLDKVPPPFNVFPDIYDALREPNKHHHHSELLLEQTGYEDLEQFVTTLLQNEQVIDQLWQNYFALTIFIGYQEKFFIDVNKILLIINLANQLFPPAASAAQSPEQHLSSLLQATVILPATIFPLPSYPEVAIATGQVAPYAIGRLKLTRYQLQSYSMGEVSQIVNVLKGEKKKVVRRSLIHTSEQSVHTTHNSNEQDSQTNETTNELLTEVQKTVAAFTKTINYDNLTVSYGPQAVYNGSWSKTMTGGAPGIDLTDSFAKAVVNKTLSRIQESVLRSRTNHTVSEKEEIQSSLFDNHQGQHNYRGIYRWVNKVYRISLENYGYRFLLELKMEDPAKGFINTQEVLNNTHFGKPLSPRQKNINSFNDITPANYVEYLSYYQVTKSLLPPEPTLTTSISANQDEMEKYIPVPPGYMATTAIVTAYLAADSALTEITGIIGSQPFLVKKDKHKEENIPLNKEITQVALAINGISSPLPISSVQPASFVLVATVTSTVSDNKLNEWKMAVYNEIVTAYQQLMQQYDDNITRYARGDQQVNPLLLTNIEKSSLYENCIDLLLQINAAKVGEPVAPSVPPGYQGNKQRYRQFMEEALEWDEMTWRFDNQPARYSYASQGPDDSLRPFLQAKAATVYLPVRPKHNYQVLYYLMSGMLWMSPYPFVPVNSVSLNIAFPLKNVSHWHHHRQEEKHWHITLPTAMQVIQEGSQLPDLITNINK